MFQTEKQVVNSTIMRRNQAMQDWQDVVEQSKILMFTRQFSTRQELLFWQYALVLFDRQSVEADNFPLNWNTTME